MVGALPIRRGNKQSQLRVSARSLSLALSSLPRPLTLSPPWSSCVLYAPAKKGVVIPGVRPCIHIHHRPSRRRIIMIGRHGADHRAAPPGPHVGHCFLSVYTPTREREREEKGRKREREREVSLFRTRVLHVSRLTRELQNKVKGGIVASRSSQTTPGCPVTQKARNAHLVDNLNVM